MTEEAVMPSSWEMKRTEVLGYRCAAMILPPSEVKAKAKMKIEVNPTGHHILSDQTGFFQKPLGYLRLELRNAACLVSQHLLQGFFQLHVCVNAHIL